MEKVALLCVGFALRYEHMGQLTGGRSEKNFRVTPYRVA